jgi:hypothetical protein
VVTSAWGGNVDFCQGERFHLVPCTPTRIQPGAYAHAEGHTWGSQTSAAPPNSCYKPSRSQPAPIRHCNI